MHSYLYPGKRTTGKLNAFLSLSWCNNILGDGIAVQCKHQAGLWTCKDNTRSGSDKVKGKVFYCKEPLREFTTNVCGVSYQLHHQCYRSSWEPPRLEALSYTDAPTPEKADLFDSPWTPTPLRGCSSWAHTTKEREQFSVNTCKLNEAPHI